MTPSAQPLATADSAVRTWGVSKRYPGRDLPALEELSLDVPAGQFAAVVGASGSGKSSLLNLVGALDTPSSGRVELFGQPLHDCADHTLTAIRRHLVGFVFQQFHLIPTLTALENVITPMIGDRSMRQRAERARETLAAVGLAGKERQLPGQLSGGEQQRVAIARALVMGPRLLLADEPTGNLDAGTGATILELLARKRREYGMAMLLATHDLDVARSADRVIGLADGRVVTDVSIGPNTTTESLVALLAGTQGQRPAGHSPR